MTREERLLGMIIGGFVGDAIGVPYEFKDRLAMQRTPCTGVTGYGTYKQPPGTWSDDSSMTYCIMDSIIKGYNATDLMENFVSWWKKSRFTATDDTFDIGITTRAALINYTYGESVESCGRREVKDNGNGSLMRTAPVIYLFKKKTFQERYAIVKEISGLTHAHSYSTLSCFFFCTLLDAYLTHEDMETAYALAVDALRQAATIEGFSELTLQKVFGRVLDGAELLQASALDTGGFVITTLEAALWCVLKSSSYEETILKAVNLGHDTDTVAAIAGNLAGVIYGYQAIPADWIQALQKRDEVQSVAIQYAALT